MFKKIFEWVSKIRNNLNEKGQGMVEYALIIAAVDGVAAAGKNGSLKDAGTGSFDSATGNIKEVTK